MSIVKDTISITVITLVAGLALGVVQDITADPIAEQKMKAKQEAYKSVFRMQTALGKLNWEIRHRSWPAYSVTAATARRPLMK